MFKQQFQITHTATHWMVAKKKKKSIIGGITSVSRGNILFPFFILYILFSFYY